MGLGQVPGADKMLKLFLLALTATSCLAMGGQEEKRIRRIIDAWNLESECWGRDNMLPYWAKRSQAIKQCARYGSPDADLSPENPFSALNTNQPNPISRLLDQASPMNYPQMETMGGQTSLGVLKGSRGRLAPLLQVQMIRSNSFLKDSPITRKILQQSWGTSPVSWLSWARWTPRWPSTWTTS